MDDPLLRLAAVLFGTTALGLAAGLWLPRLLAAWRSPPCPRCGGRLQPAGTRLLRPPGFRLGEGAPEPGLEERVRRCPRCGHEQRDARPVAQAAPDYGAASTLPPHLLADYLEAELQAGEREGFLRPVIERLRRESRQDGGQEPGRGSQG